MESIDYIYIIIQTTNDMIHSILPSKKTVLSAFNGIELVRFSKRNNSYIATVDMSKYYEACEIAESLGIMDTVAKQSVVTVNIA